MSGWTTAPTWLLLPLVPILGMLSYTLRLGIESRRETRRKARAAHIREMEIELGFEPDTSRPSYSNAEALSRMVAGDIASSNWIPEFGAPPTPPPSEEVRR